MPAEEATTRCFPAIALPRAGADDTVPVRAEITRGAMTVRFAIYSTGRGLLVGTSCSDRDSFCRGKNYKPGSLNTAAQQALAADAF
jgi:hypothetical protein